MYWGSKMETNQVLICSGSPPNLTATAAFWNLVGTLPADCTVPMQLVKLGLMTEQLTPDDSDVSVNLSSDDIFSDTKAIVPPETLSAVRRFLVEISRELDGSTKQRVGRYCEVTGLNRPPRQGAEMDAVEEAAPAKRTRWPDFFERETRDERNSSKSTGSTSSQRSSTEDDPFASGKQITKRGGERITGKNPYADSDRLKDTGLHQGGG